MTVLKNSPKLLWVIFLHSSFVFRVVARRLNWPFWLKFAPCNKRLWSYLKGSQICLCYTPTIYLTESRAQSYTRFHPAFLNAGPNIVFATVPAVVLICIPNLLNQKCIIFQMCTSNAPLLQLYWTGWSRLPLSHSSWQPPCAYAQGVAHPEGGKLNATIRC